MSFRKPARILSPLFAMLLAMALSFGGEPAAAQLLPAQGQSDTGGEEATSTSVETLLEILRDDAARAELIDQLEQAVTPAEDAPEPPPVSIGRRIADITSSVAEDIADSVQSVWRTLLRAPTLLSGFGAEEIGVILDAFGELLLVIAVTIAVFVTLRAVLIPVYRRIGAHARERSFVRRALSVLGAGAIDILVVVSSWALGYAITLVAIGTYGEIELRQSLYLNAFLAVELVKAGVRILLSPATGDLRPLPFTDWASRRCYRVCNVWISILGYGYLLIVPIIAENAGYANERSAAVVVSVLAILYAALATLRYRGAVADWLLAQSQPIAPPSQALEIEGDESAAATAEPTQTTRKRSRILRPLAQNWHWFVLFWLGWLLITVLSRPPSIALQTFDSSGRLALAIVLAFIVSGFLGRTISRGLTLPQELSARVPLLETRVNRYVPQALSLLRFAIAAGVALFALDTFGVIRTGAWLESDIGINTTSALFGVLLILLVAFLIWMALTSWVDFRLNPDYGDVPTARERTLLTLLRNAATIAILVLTLMFALSEIGLDIGPLLASAGVVGLAIGFGAQKMVQDIITGVFIQFENAINVGDVVSAGGITGAVERLTVRSVSLRDLSGIYHIIPFSSVDTVSNYTRDFSYYVIDMGVAYRESYADVKQAMFDAYDELRDHPDVGSFLIGDLEWFGLDAFGDSAVVMKARIKTMPAHQWSVGRAYNEIVKRIFDDRGIEIPFPHQTIYFGEDKEGKAPPLHLMDDRSGGN